MFFNPQRLATTAETASQESNKSLSTTHLQQHRKSQLLKTSTPKVFAQKKSTQNQTCHSETSINGINK